MLRCFHAYRNEAHGEEYADRQQNGLEPFVSARCRIRPLVVRTVDDEYEGEHYEGRAEKFPACDAFAEEKGFVYSGTIGIRMPENYIAMFGVPQAEEARRIVARRNRTSTAPSPPSAPDSPSLPPAITSTTAS